MLMNKEEAINRYSSLKRFRDASIPGYQSPITLTYHEDRFIKQIINAQENAVMGEIVMQTGVQVDKAELIRALNYDRDQYNIGYKEGYKQGIEAGKEIVLNKIQAMINGDSNET